MEKDTLHRAADTIDQLLQSHVSDQPSNIDVHDAMAVRDEIRELTNEPDEYDIPTVGDVLVDTEAVPKFGDGHVQVVEISDKCAGNHGVPSKGYQSVSELNPGHPEMSPVVLAEYVEGSHKEYAFPVTRLKDL